MDSIDYFFKVKKADIYVLCPFFEAFEGMASIRTPKPEVGDYATLRLMVAPDFQADFEKLTKTVAKRVYFERIFGAN